MTEELKTGWIECNLVLSDGTRYLNAEVWFPLNGDMRLSDIMNDERKFLPVHVNHLNKKRKAVVLHKDCIMRIEESEDESS